LDFVQIEKCTFLNSPFAFFEQVFFPGKSSRISIGFRIFAKIWIFLTVLVTAASPAEILAPNYHFFAFQIPEKSKLFVSFCH
jgi:hypothetical protein